MKIMEDYEPSAPPLSELLYPDLVSFTRDFNNNVQVENPNPNENVNNNKNRKNSKSKCKSKFTLILAILGCLLVLIGFGTLGYYLYPRINSNQPAVENVIIKNIQPIPEIRDENVERRMPIPIVLTNGTTNVTISATLVKRIYIEEDAGLKRKYIRKMTSDAFYAYERVAWGYESLKPDTNEPNGVAGSGQTILAAMSTLWVMGLKMEFEKCREWVHQNMVFDQIHDNLHVSTVVSDYVGALLSTYALTGDSMFVDHAIEIAQILEPAYLTPTGLAYGSFNPGLHQVPDTFHSEIVYPSSIGQQLLEYEYLGNIVGVCDFRLIKNRVSSIRSYFVIAQKPQNLFHMSQVNIQTGDPAHWYLSSMEDATQLLANLMKSYNQLASHKASWFPDRWYEDAIDSVEQEKLNMDSSSSCYLGAIFLLRATEMFKNGAYDENQRIERHRKLGVELAESCDEGSVRKMILPELAESYFLLYRLTHDQKYRTYAWEMVQNIQRSLRTESGGYLGVSRLITDTPTKVQPPHFLSATLKYLYLTFTPDSVLPLSEWIFNSAGHPLPICRANSDYPLGRC